MSLTVTDLFCGAGGSSLGAELAGGTLRLGLNHWERAIETHASNFQHEYVVLGNKRERMAQYGNAVTPPAMTLILERCLEALDAAA